ncbi:MULTISPECIES: helix-turn-helix domain-containing protein [unclassified Streptomyces]|uniref:helix-turn-helix domain-containing protein n=1 Tax=unclassified Streptomyces TaxID=2593676 RepID=UPI00380E79C6
MSATEFAQLLSALKERSGLSYGTLAKRMHMSTSTLHRYCNGDAVPADYAPVERLARLCKATPEELVELHRRWVLADAGRGKKQPGAALAGAEEARAEESRAEESRVEEGEPAGVKEGAVAGAGGLREGADGGEVGEVVDVAAGGPPSRVRRAVLVGAGVVLAVGALVLGVSLAGGGGGGGRDAAGAGVSAQGRAAETGAASSPSGSPSPSAPASPSGSGEPSAPAFSAPLGAGAGSAGDGPGAGADRSDGAPPLTVGVRPYAWESPCDQRYLIDREPGRVAPPPVEQDAPAWVAAHKGVAAGRQYLELTVQGTGDETVVVKGLRVRTVEKRSPLAWNAYAMGYPGVGCGGGVPTRFFTVALDAARPVLVPEAGHADFPFKVSESDPEVYYVSAEAAAYDVSWTLELSWSSGSRHGTLVLDDEGRPFRTSGENGRPSYEFPLGGSAWRPAGEEPPS